MDPTPHPAEGDNENLQSGHVGGPRRICFCFAGSSSTNETFLAAGVPWYLNPVWSGFIDCGDADAGTLDPAIAKSTLQLLAKLPGAKPTTPGGTKTPAKILNELAPGGNGRAAAKCLTPPTTAP